MAELISNRNGMGKTGWRIALVAMVVIAGIALGHHYGKRPDTAEHKTVGHRQAVARKAATATAPTSVAEEQPGAAKAARVRAAASMAPAAELTPTERKKLEAELVTAFKASVAAKPLAGPLTQRPDFVAEIEWDAIQDYARQQQDSDWIVTLLVNKLLFFKKLEVWESMSKSSGDSAQRRALARDIHALLPVLLAEKELGAQQVEEYENLLRDDL